MSQNSNENEKEKYFIKDINNETKLMSFIDRYTTKFYDQL